MRRSLPALSRLLALTLPLALSSCFTAMLWDFDDRPVHASADGTDADAPDGDADARTVQLLLTPVAVVVDVVTFPLQALGYLLLWPDC